MGDNDKQKPTVDGGDPDSKLVLELVARQVARRIYEEYISKGKPLPDGGLVEQCAAERLAVAHVGGGLVVGGLRPAQ